jgi:glutamyl-Q tRNA(Asp) synthetase
MEDVDRLRSKTDAAKAILATLERFGFPFDEEVIYQSGRSPSYRAALERLGSHVYPCSCSRKEILDYGEGRYPGTCRNGASADKPARALRVRVADSLITFNDAIQGRFESCLEKEIGDFVLYRLDTDIFSYQLAVVVDDEEQGITEVVRGSDLLDSTPRQIHLQRLLGYRSLSYLHIPVATGPDGQKLSKQNLAPALEERQACGSLWDALAFLGQAPPPMLRTADLSSLWDWALASWDAKRIPKLPVLPAP